MPEGSSSWRTLRAVAAKEARELTRDPITLGVGLSVPVLLLLIFGYGLRLDVRHTPTAVVDLDRTPASRRYVAALDRTRELDVVAELDDMADAGSRLDRGEVRLAVVIPGGFGRELSAGRPARLEVLIDGTFAATARVLDGYVEAVTASWAARERRLPVEASGPPPAIEALVWYNPSLESARSVVPGLFAVILMAFPPLLTALAIVREREQGTIRQIHVSPVRSWEFLLGKLAPYAALTTADLLLVVGIGAAAFDVPFRGSPLLFGVASAAYVVATLGIGLLVSTLARTQVVALLLVLVLTVMPSFLFSGFLYPIFSMPQALRAYTYLFPGRHFVAVTRGVLLRGGGFERVGRDLALLGGYAAAVLALAALRLRARPV